jgi:hypothetical protein
LFIIIEYTKYNNKNRFNRCWKRIEKISFSTKIAYCAEGEKEKRCYQYNLFKYLFLEVKINKCTKKGIFQNSE